MKWKIEKKHIIPAVPVLVIILLSLLFNNLLQEGTKYKNIGDTVKNTFSPIFWGFILAYLLNPIMKKLEKFVFMPLAKRIYRKKDAQAKQKKLSRVLGVIFTFAVFLLLVIGGLCVVIPQLYESVKKIIGDIPEYYVEVEKWVKEFLEDNNEVSTYVLGILDSSYERLSGYINDVVIPNADEIVKGITSGIITGVKSVLNILLAMIISVYVLFEKENLIASSKKVIYSYIETKRANIALTAVRHVNNVFGGFINGKIVDSFIIGVMCYIFMLITGFEYALLISIIVGVTNIIPYFGPFIGAIPSVFLLLVIDPKQGLVFAVFVFILQQLDGNIIGPLILGESLKLSSMWILIAILIGGGLFGVPGMILGAPTLACICAVLENDTGKRLDKKSLPTSSKDFLTVESVEISDDNVKIKHFEEKEDKKKNKNNIKK